MSDAPEEEFIIRLDQFIKFQGLVDTGGQAKLLIQDGQVLVNGELETRRRRKLRLGDVVETLGQQILVAFDDYDAPSE